MKVASLIIPPDSGFCCDSVGFERCCIDVVGVVVDGVILSRLATEVVDEAATEVCVDVSPIAGESRGPAFLSGCPFQLRRRYLRIRSRFLGSELDIIRNSVVLSSTGKMDGQD